MFGIRKKLLLGQIMTLVIIGVLGYATTGQINKLGSAVDVILKENYSSVRASNNIIISIDNINRNILFGFSGIKTINIRDIGANFENVKNALKTEMEAITLEGEKEKAEKISKLFEEYRNIAEKIVKEPSEKIQLKIYVSELLPSSDKIRAEASAILEMNQANMDNASLSAKTVANSVFKTTAAMAGIAVFLILISGYILTRWILGPVKTLLESTKEIKKGNLDLVVDLQTKDELGALSDSFNDMTAALREIRDSEHINLMRTKKTTEEIFDALPAAIAVSDLDGNIVFSTQKAKDQFGLKKGISLKNKGYEKIHGLFSKVIDSGIESRLDEKDGYMEKEAGSEMRFFDVAVIPIPLNMKIGDIFAAAVIIEDITGLLEQKQSKRDALSAFSRQLRAPLSSLNTAIYVILSEKAGELNDKQTELMVSARDDGEKLSAILDDILKFNGIEAYDKFTEEYVYPKDLAETAVDKIMAEAKEKGVALSCLVPDELPHVMADKDKILQVLGNLISNALSFTDPGGEIKVEAEKSEDNVLFRVTDTGRGIDPKDMPHIFDMFYRTEDGEGKKGLGLGLAAAKEIVVAHGGEIRCESEKNKGSVFEFSLKTAAIKEENNI